MKSFSDGKIIVTFLIQNLEIFILLKVLLEYEHWKGVCQNLGKNSESSFLGTVFSRAKCRLSGNKKILEGQIFKQELHILSLL